MRIENHEDKVDKAKSLLKDILKQSRSVQEVYAYCKAKCPELTKGEIKEARKQLGVASKARFGIYYWSLPEEEQQ